MASTWLIPGIVSTREVMKKIREKLKPVWNPAFWQSDNDYYRFGTLIPRSNCILDTTMILKAGIMIRPVGEALDEALARWVPEKRG